MQWNGRFSSDGNGGCPCSLHSCYSELSGRLMSSRKFMLIRNGQWPGLAWKIQMGLAIVSVRAVYIYKHIYIYALLSPRLHRFRSLCISVLICVCVLYKYKHGNRLNAVYIYIYIYISIMSNIIIIDQFTE